MFDDPMESVVPHACEDPEIKTIVSKETATIALKLLDVLTTAYTYGRTGDAWSENLSAQVRMVILKGNEVRKKEKWEEKS